MAPSDKNYHLSKKPPQPNGYKIFFDSVLLKEKDQDVFEIYPLKMEINEGEIICIC